MRWNQTIDKNTVRYCRAFLFLPKTINGETRWLETAAWTEEYKDGTLFTRGRWVPTGWISLASFKEVECFLR